MVNHPSGVNGYHTLFTKDNTLNPSEHTDDTCYAYISNTGENARTYTVGTVTQVVPLLMVHNYLIIQSEDNSGNVSTKSQLFTYKYDGTNPNPPSSVSSTNPGYSSK